MKRNLDGVYFRVKREEKYESICFSDLTPLEQDKVLKDRTNEWLKEMCKILGQTIKEIGNHFDIIKE